LSTTTTDYLIQDLRLHLGDINPSSYRYTDEWLNIALLASIKSLGKWWNFKYLVDTSNEVYRNPNTIFLFPEPPVIEVYDERIIILMASLIIKEGTLENNAWSTISWRDNEISFSNLEGSRSRQASISKDWDELTSLLTPPTKRLSRPIKGSLPGYKGNIYESEGEY